MRWRAGGFGRSLQLSTGDLHWGSTLGFDHEPRHCLQWRGLFTYGNACKKTGGNRSA